MKKTEDEIQMEKVLLFWKLFDQVPEHRKKKVMKEITDKL